MKTTILIFALIIASAWLANAMYLVTIISMVAAIVISIQLDTLYRVKK